MSEIEMVVVNGIRYRPEDAPKIVEPDVEDDITPKRPGRGSRGAARTKAVTSSRNKARAPESDATGGDTSGDGDGSGDPSGDGSGDPTGDGAGSDEDTAGSGD